MIGPRYREDLCLDAAAAWRQARRHHADRPTVVGRRERYPGRAHGGNKGRERAAINTWFSGPVTETAERAPTEIDDADLGAAITEALDRWPSAGLAVGVIRDGGPTWFHGHGVADIASKAPITQDTVFRIGSITKTFTAIAIMQLSERGLLQLDAPANDYLRTFRLVPANPRLQPATVRHLLTHTAGIGYWRRFSDLLRPGVGSGVQAGRTSPSLADYYRRGVPVEIEPGTKWVYSNHGFAALGQIVEDVGDQPLDSYLREHVLPPPWYGEHRPSAFTADPPRPGHRIRAALPRTATGR